MHTGARQHFNDTFSRKIPGFSSNRQYWIWGALYFQGCRNTCFIPKTLGKKLLQGVEDISELIAAPEFPSDQWSRHSASSASASRRCPHHLSATWFWRLSWQNGELTPQLIEMQGFPSLYFYQHLLAYAYRKHFDIPEGYNHLFNGIDAPGYRSLCSKVIIGDSKPENVILLEVNRKNKIRIDFWGTQNTWA